MDDNDGDGSCERGERRESEQGECRERGEEHGGRVDKVVVCGYVPGRSDGVTNERREKWRERFVSD